ncbi:MAG: WalW protein [Pseudomonadales bacterium]|jgi:hypothetical protein|nr:WalW protein [Pseudomonadales bacterium]
MASIHRVQRVFDRYGLVPCYVVDYPVVSKKEGVGPLQEIHADGRCEIGAQLHPWVNPPLVEELTRRNSYPGNLSPELERGKLRILRERIDEEFGVAPIVYKAGRYGFGSNTERILGEMGFRVDLSFCPPFDSTADGGPDYSREGADPFWFQGSAGASILEIPVTGAFVGWGGPLMRPLFGWADRLRQFRLPGALARARIVDRLMLSPEGYTFEEHVRLTRHLLARGTRVFTWSFHSPSVEPGHTPYVRSKVQLHAFLDQFERFFDFFFGEVQGQPTSPSALLARLDSSR